MFFSKLCGQYTVLLYRGDVGSDTKTPFEEATEKYAEKRDEMQNNVEVEDKFHLEMTAGEILRKHPEAGIVLASYHLGGCSHCGINEEHKLVDICAGYGVPSDALLDSLNSLLED